MTVGERQLRAAIAEATTDLAAFFARRDAALKELSAAALAEVKQAGLAPASAVEAEEDRRRQTWSRRFVPGTPGWTGLPW